jgi:hypothetical protein
MAAMAICMALVLAGVVVVAWGGETGSPDGSGGLLRRAGVALAAGLVAGLIGAGAGGRLVMRLLALTSPEAEGGFTEAGEVVGEITVGGTLGFILFSGLPAGVLSGALYALLLPRGRVAGAALGALLLVLAGTRIDPLRPDSVDFALLDPAWLAVLAFAVVGIFHGMVLTAVAARMSRGGAGEPARTWRWTPARIAAGVLATVALPGFVLDVADVLGSG